MSQIDDILYFEEGYRRSAYYDSLSYPTIGIGKKLGPQYTPLDVYQFDVPVDVAKAWVSDDCLQIANLIANDQRTAGAWSHCNDARQDMMVAMAYQLGFGGLCKFKKTLNAIENENWQEAHDQMLDSLWHKQTPERCEREANVMLHGTYDTYDGLLAA
jgi:GH24 family phage-related lysozyme (muramidase)